MRIFKRLKAWRVGRQIKRLEKRYVQKKMEIESWLPFSESYLRFLQALAELEKKGKT